MLALLILISHLMLGSTSDKDVQVANNTVQTTVANNQDRQDGSVVENLSQDAPKLKKSVLKLALQAYEKASEKGLVKNPVLTVIDYSLPSSKRRMWVFDMKEEKLLYKTHVAHGKNSGRGAVSNHFSNKVSSKQSSLGTYVTKETYVGHRGYSLNLQGLDKGFNDNALERRVVVHGAWYVEPTFIKKAGHPGASWGCPAVADTLAKPIINTIKNGSIIFAYYPNENFLSQSKFLEA